jgi:hypothetical protein
MDQGTDALNIFHNRVIPLKLGYTGVINRSQKDINTGKPINESLQSERDFFMNSSIYRGIASQLGTEFLTKRLSALLLQHIQHHLPSIKQRINQVIMEAQLEAQSYRPPYEFEQQGQQKGPLLLDLLSKYAASVISSLVCFFVSIFHLFPSSPGFFTFFYFFLLFFTFPHQIQSPTHTPTPSSR